MSTTRTTSPFGFSSTADDVVSGLDLHGRRALVTGADISKTVRKPIPTIPPWPAPTLPASPPMPSTPTPPSTSGPSPRP
jgi:hypothetical protein